MSFKCDRCGTVQKTGTSPIKQVMEIREIIYQPITKNARGEIVYKNDKDRSFGHEIVSEQKLCESCSLELAKANFIPEVVGRRTNLYWFTKKKDAHFVKKSDLVYEDE